MKLSKRAFSKKYNIEIQWLTSLCFLGVIPFSIKRGKRNTVYVEDQAIDLLKKIEHYVECPFCMKKMACVTNKHYKICNPSIEIKKDLYSGVYLKNHKKTERQKTAQSEKLKERFLTSEGEITRKQIGEASKKLNADPEYKKKQKETFNLVQNRPGMKQLHRKRALKMWANPDYQEKRKEYVKQNIELLRESARKARQYSKKQSNLHINYKKNMLEKGLSGFISEYPYGPYSIDEADPLAKIVVEVDGCYWHGCSLCGFKGDDGIKATDKRKTSFLKNRGWLVLRIKEHEIKKDPYVAIEMIRNIQQIRRQNNINLIKQSFLKGSLKVKSMVNKELNPTWVPINNILRHHTPHKNMYKICTDMGSVVVTEDHSLFSWQTKEPIKASDLKSGDLIVGLPIKEFEPAKVISTEIVNSAKYSYDVSVPDSENAVLDNGILVHNSYSISGVSLDIEKSSKYQSIADVFSAQYDKTLEAAKQSIKIIKGLRQFRYGIGISSALGPLTRPGIQSRRSMIESGSVGTWS